jgi:hypothetical protein
VAKKKVTQLVLEAKKKRNENVDQNSE